MMELCIINVMTRETRFDRHVMLPSAKFQVEYSHSNEQLGRSQNHDHE
jgi:hypothetical protein